MSPSQKTARGYEEPFAIQFSIFLANRVGQLKEMVNIFLRQSVRVLGLSIVDSTNWAVIRVICSDPDKARELLKRHPLPFTESAVLAVELASDDTLSEIASCLLRAEISVHFAYPLTLRSHENPVMVFHVDDTVFACHTLIRHGFVLLGHEDLADAA